jgi:hypothetical protein
MKRNGPLLLAAAALTATVLLAIPPFLLIAANSDSVLVVDGYILSREARSEWRERSCLGFRYHDRDVRDGMKTYCVGVPFGAWTCFVSESDDPAYQVPCR